MKEKHIRIAEPHSQLVVRVTKFLPASNPMNADVGVDGSSGGSLCNVVCDESSETACSWKNIYLLLSPQKRKGESSSSPSSSSILGDIG